MQQRAKWRVCGDFLDELDGLAVYVDLIQLERWSCVSEACQGNQIARRAQRASLRRVADRWPCIQRSIDERSAMPGRQHQVGERLVCGICEQVHSLRTNAQKEGARIEAIHVPTLKRSVWHWRALA